MSTSTELERIQKARNTIRDKLVELGLAASTAKLDALATAIDGVENRAAVSATVQEGDTYTIPKGYHNGSGTVSGVTGGGNYSLQSKTVTPTKNQQNVTPDSGYYGLSDVTVAPIPEAYQNVSSVTATAPDVLATKIVVAADGSVITGSMANNGAVAQTLSIGTQTYTIPAGYHNGLGSVKILPEEKGVTPTKAAQEIVPTAGKVLSKVTVAAIPAAYQVTTNVDATAADVLDGKTIVLADGSEVTGTMPDRGAVSKVLDATTDNQTYIIPDGHHDGTGVVSIALETKTATPSPSAQSITPTAGKVLSKVTIDPIPSQYADTSSATSSAADILSGKIAYGVDESGDAIKITGTMANNGAIAATIDGLSITSYTVPTGFTSGGTVSLTNDIEMALAAI